MAVVDVDSVGLDDLFELVDETLSRGLNTQHLVNFYHIVAICFPTVDLEVGKTLAQVRAVCLKNDEFEIVFGLFVDLVLVGRCINETL